MSMWVSYFDRLTIGLKIGSGSMTSSYPSPTILQPRSMIMWGSKPCREIMPIEQNTLDFRMPPRVMKLLCRVEDIVPAACPYVAIEEIPV